MLCDFCVHVAIQHYICDLRAEFLILLDFTSSGSCLYPVAAILDGVALTQSTICFSASGWKAEKEATEEE